MLALDDLKNKWRENQPAFPAAAPYDTVSFNQLIRTRMKKQNNIIFRYFWVTFTLHLLVYALLSHVLIRNWADTNTLVLSLFGIFVTVPFTATMLRRYKQMAATKINPENGDSIYNYLDQQQNRLANFYGFKKRYEIILTPLLSAIGVILVFNLYFPGGVTAYPTGAIITFLITLFCCLYVIRSENKKYFIRPLLELQATLNDFKS
jgi:uncharacterized membrane protein YhaH (DUF805 family)